VEYYPVYKCKLCGETLMVGSIDAETPEEAVEKADKVYLHKCLARTSMDVTKRYGVSELIGVQDNII